MIRKLIILSMFSALVGCGGGGGSDGGTTGPLPGERPTGVISGTAHDGLVINGDVTIYDFTGGVKGAALKTGVTDSLGRYSLSIQTTDKPILIEIKNGQYAEEASGQIVQLDVGDTLYAAQNYVSGEPVKISATYFTTLAVGLAEYEIGRASMTTNQAIDYANAKMSAISGVDIENVTPVDVSIGDNATFVLTDQHLYGFRTASISEWTKQASADNGEVVHERQTSIKFISKAYEDIKADGVLNGLGAEGSALSMGVVPLSMDVYRTELPAHMLKFVVSNKNQTGLVFDDLKQEAINYSTSTDIIYASTTGPDLLTYYKPSVSNFTPSDGATITGGSFQADAVLNDIYGIYNVEYYLDGSYWTSSGGADASRIINSSSWSNGVHDFTIKAISIGGASTSVTHELTVSNTPPTIAFFDRVDTITSFVAYWPYHHYVSGSLVGAAPKVIVSATNLDVSSVTMYTSAATYNAFKLTDTGTGQIYWTAPKINFTASGGCEAITIKATDTAGNSKTTVAMMERYASYIVRNDGQCRL